jgi:hypothetical protein
LVKFGIEPTQTLTGHVYTNPQGVRVHQYKLVLTRTQAESLRLLLHTGAEDSLTVKILSVVGMRTYNERNIRTSAKDLILIGPDATAPLDCGSAQPCKPNRLVVDIRLADKPQTDLWVCQIVLKDDAE